MMPAQSHAVVTFLFYYNENDKVSCKPFIFFFCVLRDDKRKRKKENKVERGGGVAQTQLTGLFSLRPKGINHTTRFGAAAYGRAFPIRGYIDIG